MLPCLLCIHNEEKALKLKVLFTFENYITLNMLQYGEEKHIHTKMYENVWKTSKRRTLLRMIINGTKYISYIESKLYVIWHYIDPNDEHWVWYISKKM